MAAHPAQGRADGGAVTLIQLDEHAAVGQILHEGRGLVGVLRRELTVQVLAVGKGRVLHVAGGQQVDQGGNLGHRFFFRGGGQGAGALGVHGFRAEELLGGLFPALFAVHHLSGVQGDFAGLFHLNVKVGQLSDHRCETAAGPHDAADQRAHAGQPRQRAQNLRVGGQGVHTLGQFDPRAVQQRHHRRAGDLRHAQHFENLLRLGLGHGPAAVSEILGEAIHRLAVHRAAAGHHVAVLLQRVHFHKAARVKQLRGPLPGCAFAVGMLLGDAFGVPLQDGGFFSGQRLQFFGHFHSLFPHFHMVSVMKVRKNIP